MKSCKLLIDGRWVEGESTFPVEDKFTGEVVAEVSRASRRDVANAVGAAKRAFETKPLDPYRRYEILHEASSLVEKRRDELVSTIIAESGFTGADATAEVNRCIQTLLISAEESKRIRGEMVPLEGAPGQTHRMGFTIRVPLGVVCAITPFNSPLNTVAHKVAPALAAGNGVVLKPASYTPVTAVVLCEILSDAGLPPGYLNLVCGSGGTVGNWLLEEQNIRFYTFTGGTDVGKIIQQAAGLRRTQLELGAISATIVCEDADLDRAVPKCVSASFRKAGQVCTSVQRLYVHESILDRFVEGLVAQTEAAKVGDPREPETLVGPMIDFREAERAEIWVNEAVEQDAEIVTGGKREGALFYPTIIKDARPEMRVMCREIFAPVISIVPFHSLNDAIEQVNATPYGLAAGLFTTNINKAMLAARRLEVGSVYVNETSSSRVDLMPYGGTKESGFGREGPKYAIQEMTEERLIAISLH
jgi:succinate-semialdehyde dehydrogenase/glutarate-semialdehyde dehydrogenase